MTRGGAMATLSLSPPIPVERVSVIIIYLPFYGGGIARFGVQDIIVNHCDMVM